MPTLPSNVTDVAKISILCDSGREMDSMNSSTGLYLCVKLFLCPVMEL